VEDDRLLWRLESEKDTYPRYAQLTPTTLLAVAERLDRVPNVIALRGWAKPRTRSPIGAGYSGVDAVQQGRMRFFGKDVAYFSSSHERSHLMTALGMARPEAHDLTTVLVWEGVIGSFYLVDQRWQVVRTVPVLAHPRDRYAFLFSLADPTFPDRGSTPRSDGSGKLMALAAHGDPTDADTDIKAVVDRILTTDVLNPAPKAEFASTALYNAGVESQATKTAAALLTQRIFDGFAEAAVRELPAGTPLRISGVRSELLLELLASARPFQLSVRSSMPQRFRLGHRHGYRCACASSHRQPIEWSVYGGLEFIHDSKPDSRRWRCQPRDDRSLAAAIASGRVVARVQCRREIGPRALGNRSLLAEPYSPVTQDKLNAIKQREQYQPIAPCCREQDLAEAFIEDFPDLFMLYFRRVRSPW
jgi:hydroxymethyl cephem carbamoyltransferase